MKLFVLISLTFYFFSFVTIASEADIENSSEELSSRFGSGKAIEAFDKEQGFKLSSKAAAAMNVSFLQLEKKGPWRLPQEAIIHLKQSTGVYRKYEGWVSMVLVKILKREGNDILIISEDLELGDEVAISGAIFLRMTDADLNSGTVDSCTH